jgi:hypothetical protein
MIIYTLFLAHALVIIIGNMHINKLSVGLDPNMVLIKVKASCKIIMNGNGYIVFNIGHRMRSNIKY